MRLWWCSAMRQAVMDQMMDFQSVGLMTVIHAFAKMVGQQAPCPH